MRKFAQVVPFCEYYEPDIDINTENSLDNSGSNETMQKVLASIVYIRNKTLEKTTTNPAYYTPGKFSKTCHNFILIKFSPNYVFLWLLGSCDIISLVNWHSGNYAFGLVHDPYVALDGTPVGNYFFFISWVGRRGAHRRYPQLSSEC